MDSFGFKERKMDVPESSTKMDVTKLPHVTHTNPMSFTALAFTFDDEEGIIVAADHLSDSSSIVELNSHMLATICGGSTFLLQDLQKMCYLQEQNEGRETSVAEVLKWLAESLSAFEEELSIQILIAVWNESEHALYCMNGKGELVKDDALVIGCSSASNTLQKRMLCCKKDKLSVTKAADLALIFLCWGAYKSPYHGHYYSVYHLGRSGSNKLEDGDLETRLYSEG